MHLGGAPNRVWSGQDPKVEEELARLTVLEAVVSGPGAHGSPCGRREGSPFGAVGSFAGPGLGGGEW